MKKQKDSKIKEMIDKDVEKIFDSTWNNWESRRKCERTHIPEYKKKKIDNKDS